MIRVLTLFAPLFSKSVFQHVQVLLAGAILAPGKRTVASALRGMGLEEERHFCRYHRVLSRAAWSSREASRLLLGLLVEAFVPDGPLVVGVDETLERRQGKKIAAKRDLPRPGQIQPHPLRKNECSAVGLPDAAGSRSMGLSGLGLALPFGAGLFRTLHK